MHATTLLAAAWFALLLIVFVFTAPLADALFLLFPMLMVMFLLTGSILGIVALVRAKARWRRSAAILAILAIGGSLYASNLGFRWGRVVLFQLRKPAYEQQLARAIKVGRVPKELGCTDAGPPMIHGLYWQSGVLEG